MKILHISAIILTLTSFSIMKSFDSFAKSLTNEQQRIAQDFMQELSRLPEAVGPIKELLEKVSGIIENFIDVVKPHEMGILDEIRDKGMELIYGNVDDLSTKLQSIHAERYIDALIDQLNNLHIEQFLEKTIIPAGKALAEKSLAKITAEKEFTANIAAQFSPATALVQPIKEYLSKYGITLQDLPTIIRSKIAMIQEKLTTLRPYLMMNQEKAILVAQTLQKIATSQEAPMIYQKLNIIKEKIADSVSKLPSKKDLKSTADSIIKIVQKVAAGKNINILQDGQRIASAVRVVKDTAQEALKTANELLQIPIILDDVSSKIGELSLPKEVLDTVSLLKQYTQQDMESLNRIFSKVFDAIKDKVQDTLGLVQQATGFSL